MEKNKTTLMIGFNRRFDPNFAALEKRIRDGDVGDVEMATIISRDPAPPPADYVKSSGGIFRDMMIHDFDLARFLVGEEFVVVNALGCVARRQGDRRGGRLSTPRRCRCRRRPARSPSSPIRAAPPMAMTSASRCTAPRACCAPATCTTPRSRSQPPTASRPTRSCNFFTERYGQAYANEVLTFIDAVTSGKPRLRPSGHDGLQAQKLADAATESWKTGKPVKVA